MKYIPTATFLLWLLIVLGSHFNPGLFLREYLQYPLVVLLSILLPVSFWLKAKDKKRGTALVFLGLLMINTCFLSFAINQIYSNLRSQEVASYRGIVPELVEMLMDSESIEKRRFAAKLIYQNHAISVPYKTAEKSFELYLPTAKDRANYQENAQKRTLLDISKMNKQSQLVSAIFLLAIHAGLFLLLLPFLIIYDKE